MSTMICLIHASCIETDSVISNNKLSIQLVKVFIYSALAVPLFPWINETVSILLVLASNTNISALAGIQYFYWHLIFSITNYYSS